MPAVALLASRTVMEASIHHLIAGCRGCTVIHYLEEHGKTSLRFYESLEEQPRWSGSGVVMLAGADWPCVQSYEVVGGSTPVWLLACSLRVTRELSLTASPPQHLRRHWRSVLLGYTRRLIREGASLERLAARVVLGGGSPLALIAIVVDYPRRAPVAIMAGRRFCVRHAGRWASLTTLGLEGCTLLEDSVAVLKLQGGLPRVEVRSLDYYR